MRETYDFIAVFIIMFTKKTILAFFREAGDYKEVIQNSLRFQM